MLRKQSGVLVLAVLVGSVGFTAGSIRAGVYIAGYTGANGSTGYSTGTLTASSGSLGTAAVTVSLGGSPSTSGAGSFDNLYYGIQRAAIETNRSATGTNPVTGGGTFTNITQPAAGGGDVNGALSGQWGTANNDEVMTPQTPSGTTMNWFGRSSVRQPSVSLANVLFSLRLNTVSSSGSWSTSSLFTGMTTDTTNGIPGYITVPAASSTSAFVTLNAYGSKTNFTDTTQYITLFNSYNGAYSGAGGNTAHSVWGATWFGLNTSLNVASNSSSNWQQTSDGGFGLDNFVRNGATAQTVVGVRNNVAKNASIIPAGTTTTDAITAGTSLGTGFSGGGTNAFGNLTVSAGVPVASNVTYSWTNAAVLTGSSVTPASVVSASVPALSTAMTTGTFGVGSYNGDTSNNLTLNPIQVVGPVINQVTNPANFYALIQNATTFPSGVSSTGLAIQNNYTGSAPADNRTVLTLNSAAVTGTGWAFTGVAGTTIAKGVTNSSMTLQVNAPTAGLTTRGGTSTASGLSIDTDQNTVRTGNGTDIAYANVTATAVAPVNSLSTTSHSFGNVLVGTSATPLTLTVSNVGDGNRAPAALGSARNLHGSLSVAAGPFSGAGGTLNSGTGLGDSFGGPTSTQNFSYGYSPTVRGPNSTNVTAAFTDGSTANDNAAQNRTVGLSGTGVAPVNSLNTTSLAFGNVRIGTSGGPLGVTITNIGDGNLSGLGAVSNLNGTMGTATNPVFGGAGGALSLTDSSATTFNYTYSPTAHSANSATATAAFTNGNTAQDNTAQNQVVNLSGTGNGPIYSSSGPANFNALVNYNATPSTVTISNTSTDPGTGALTDLTIRADSSASATGFSLGGIATVISKGNSGGISLNADTTAIAGFLKGSTASTDVNIRTDEDTAFGGLGNQFNYTGVQITGVAPVNDTPASLALGTVRVGQSSSANLSIQNVGNGNLATTLPASVTNLNNTGVSLTSNPSGNFSGSSAGFSLGDGGSQNVAFTFAPTSRGAFSATATSNFSNGNNDAGVLVSSPNNNAADSQATTLSGTGVGPVYTASTAPYIVGGTPPSLDLATIYFQPALEPPNGMTRNLVISNLTTDTGVLANLTLLSGALSGPYAALFSLGISFPQTITPGNSLIIPINFTAAYPPGTKLAQLMISSDQNAPGGVGMLGDIFTYNLEAQVVPEPATILIWSGLFGCCAAYRRWRGRGARVTES